MVEYDLNIKKEDEKEDIVYVPLKRSDIFRLIQFLYTKDESLLTESLVKTLMKYRVYLK